MNISRTFKLIELYTAIFHSQQKILLKVMNILLQLWQVQLLSDLLLIMYFSHACLKSYQDDLQKFFDHFDLKQADRLYLPHWIVNFP